MKYDVVIFGGGTSGISCAYNSAKLGLKTLLIEKTDVLGGAITQGLVIPVMKVDTHNINTEFYSELIKEAAKVNAQNTYLDGNTGWFNPELLKIVFDKMLSSVGCDILFSTYPISINKNDDIGLFNITLFHKILSLHIDTKYIVDATSNAEIFKLLNFEFQNDTTQKQASSLRFILGGIDINKFALWLEEIDDNKDVTTIQRDKMQIHLSTACTWDNTRNWALSPFFMKGIENGVLNYEDTAYFQVFTVPGMPTSLAVNAPRIILKDGEDINNPFTYSNALKQGRERIYRLYNFLKNYFIGFENSYISHISDTLGVRESYRIKGKYTYTINDIIEDKSYENVAFTCDYPIDIHSNNKEEDKLQFSNYTYKIPIETLIAEKDDNVYGIGRIISADFKAHSALRTQMSCFSMGEAVAKHIKSKCKI